VGEEKGPSDPPRVNATEPILHHAAYGAATLAIIHGYLHASILANLALADS
jgi:hypothetical protein